MVSSIGSASVAQAPLAQAAKPRVEDAAAAAQADAATTTDSTADATATDSSTETQSALSSATARVGDELQGQAGASRVQRAGGGTAAPAASESADYIAEADTNSDKKISDQERVAYEKKLAQQAKAEALSQEVRKAYGLAGEPEPSVAVTA